MTAATDAELHIPRGELLRSRVVSDLGTPLATALDRELTGYATVVPQETLLLAGDVRGVLTFEAGVPVLAYNSVTDNGGGDALAELAVPGPYRVELYDVAVADLEPAHEADALRVAPGSVATELADDPELAERTRAAAPDDRLAEDDADDADAVAAFLDDDERIEAIREQAREEARTRAEEWGFDDALEDPPADHAPGDPPADHAPGDPPADHAPGDPPADHAPGDPPSDHAPGDPPSDHAPGDPDVDAGPSS